VSSPLLARQPPRPAPSRRARQLDPRGFLDYVTEAVPRAGTGGTVALLVLDLRRGDRLEALMATRDAEARFERVLDALERLLRTHDRYAPVSRDEIWVALPGLGDASVAVLAAIRCVHELRLPDADGQPDLQLRPCAGIAYFPEHGPDARELVRVADAACKAAALTEEGYCVATQREAAALPDDPHLADRVREAVRANALEVHYQPQIDIATGRCTAAEALVRWPSADAKPVPPFLIAQVAERSEINQAFTLFILNTALRHRMGLRRAGIELRMSVNFSARLLDDDELPDLVAQSLEAWSVPAEQLTVELTESSVVKDVSRSVRVLERVRQLGVRLAMDDFGTGYASLAQFKRLPFDEIKIDKLFVQNMLQTRGDDQIVRAMLDLAHNFGQGVVAEGVEDLPTLVRLRELGCDLAQGYHISKALPEASFRAWWLARHESGAD
jgi:EAL domain-containing protein (putative c-di-GMP-specific phosphodiesterase class I)/GGDEF domain-containing protein